MAKKKVEDATVVEEVKEETPKKRAPRAKKEAAEKPAEKPAKAKKEAKVEEKPAKPMPTEAKATALNVRLTPRKARLVIDLIRGKSVSEAVAILENTNRAASAPVLKVLKSAVANATNNYGMDEEKLYVASIWANDGLRMKRYLPRAKGSASGLVKRNCHITVVVKMR